MSAGNHGAPMLRLLAAAFLCTFQPTSSLYTMLQGGVGSSNFERCFYEKVPPKSTLHISLYASDLIETNAQLIGAKRPPQELTVRLWRGGNGKGNPIVEEILGGVGEAVQANTGGVDTFTYSYTATYNDSVADPSSTFALCATSLASNKFADVLLRIEIDLDVKADGELDIGYAHVVQEDGVNDVSHRVKALQSQMLHMKRRLIMYRDLEDAARETVDESFVNVRFLCICQVVFVVVVGCWQMYHLRQFFRMKKLV